MKMKRHVWVNFREGADFMYTVWADAVMEVCVGEGADFVG